MPVDVEGDTVHVPAAEHAAGGIKGALTKRIGPLPAWGWGVVAVAGVFVVIPFLQSHSLSSATSGTGAAVGNGAGGTSAMPSVPSVSDTGTTSPLDTSQGVQAPGGGVGAPGGVFIPNTSTSPGNIGIQPTAPLNSSAFTPVLGIPGSSGGVPVGAGTGPTFPNETRPVPLPTGQLENTEPAGVFSGQAAQDTSLMNAYSDTGLAPAAVNGYTMPNGTEIGGIAQFEQAAQPGGAGAPNP